ncbi:MAG: hypothetical protein V4772_15625 [Pseudomonadota bacterium]
MKRQELRAEVLALLGVEQLRAVDALIADYEREQMELCIDGCEPEPARRKVQAAREIRGMLKPPAERRES